jgi:capsular polysaccharide biosynthesis protein
MRLKQISNKIKNKILNMISAYVPINTKYKPKGVVSWENLRNNQSVDYYEINPPYTSSLTLSSKFVEDCSSYNKPVQSIESPGDFVIGISQGRIYNVDAANIAIISQDNFVIDAVSFQWRVGERLAPSSENTIFDKKMFTAPKKYSGTVFSLLSGGGATDYYYHWVIDSIPRLYLLKQSGLHDQVNYFLVPNYAYAFQKQYLKHFGICESRIIDATQVRHIQADRLIVTSYIRVMAHLPPWVPKFLHHAFVDPSPSERRKLIYIARGDAARNRKVLNEAELIQMLQRMGFEIYFLSTLDVKRQAELFSTAEIIVASHGGGLTNLVFCQTGTKVLEFFPDNYVNHLFYDICVKNGLVYDYLVCSSNGFTGNDLDRAAANVVADLQAIGAKIRAMLA